MLKRGLPSQLTILLPNSRQGHLSIRKDLTLGGTHMAFTGQKASLAPTTLAVPHHLYLLFPLCTTVKHLGFVD